MAKETPFVGQLTEKVQVYALTTVRNSLGEPEPAKTLLCDTRAAVNDTAGTRETDESMRLVMDRSYIIRKRAGVLGGKDLRLQDGDAVYLVNHVRKIGRTHLELVCVAFGDDKLPE